MFQNLEITSVEINNCDPSFWSKVHLNSLVFQSTKSTVADCEMEHLNIADVPADMLDRYLRKLFQTADLDGNGNAVAHRSICLSVCLSIFCLSGAPPHHRLLFQESSIDKSLRQCLRKVGCSLVHRKSCG